MPYTRAYAMNKDMAVQKESKIKSPAEKYLCADARTGGWWGVMGWPCNNYYAAKNPEARHNEGANFLFVDGHVKWLRAEKWKEREAPWRPWM